MGTLLKPGPKRQLAMTKMREGCFSLAKSRDTLLVTNISPFKGPFENDLPFPNTECVSSLEGILVPSILIDIEIQSCGWGFIDVA